MALAVTSVMVIFESQRESLHLLPLSMGSFQKLWNLEIKKNIPHDQF